MIRWRVAGSCAEAEAGAWTETCPDSAKPG